MGKPVHCILLLGKLGALYSAGLYQYAEELRKLRNVTASVHDYGYWHPFTGSRNAYSDLAINRARTGYKVALLGHSMGATGISMIARDMGKAGCSVDLVFSLDCSRFSMPIPLGANIKNTVTFCDPSHIIGGVQQIKSPVYQGKWDAKTTSGISHVAYDDVTNLRLRALGEVKLLTT